MGDVDIDLTRCLAGATRVTINTERNVVQYLCNYPFGEVLNPCSSRKFPGTMVSTIRRQDIPKITGNPITHTAYAPQEIVAWIKPVHRTIPPLHFHEQQKPINNKHTIIDKKISVNIVNLEFGRDGYFEFVGFNYVLANTLKHITFGRDGMFEPYS